MMDSSSNRSKRQSKIIISNWYEVKGDIEDRLEQSYAIIQSISNLSEKEAYDALLQIAADQAANPIKPKFHGNEGLDNVVINGLIYSFLTEPQNTNKNFSLLAAMSTDNWFCALCNVNVLLFESYRKLRNEVREQLFILFREAIKSNVPKIDNVLINLIRNANDGADLKDNCILLNAVVGMLNENSAWLTKLKPRASLIPVALQTFTRFISDLSIHAQFEDLRNQMINLCVWFINERFHDCLQLGRDFILILMRVAKVPQFSQIWNNLLNNPSKLASNFTGLEEILNRSCPLSLAAYRISVTIHRKIDFLFKMKPGTHEKHFEWIRKQHLENTDAASLRAEIIRSSTFFSWSTPPQFFHDMRALLVTSLMSLNNNQADQQWCKLYLLWDWFCYDSKPGSHTAIEPGLTILRSLFHLQPMLANSMIDFLVRMSSELYMPLQNRFVLSIINSFKVMNETNPGSLLAIVDNSLLQKNVREAFKETFKGLFAPGQGTPSITTASEIIDLPPLVVSESENQAELMEYSSLVIADEGIGSLSVATPSMQIDEQMEEEDDATNVDKITTLLAAVKEEFRDFIENLSSTPISESETRCDMVQKLLNNIFEYDELLDEEQIELISECLLIALGKDVRLRFPLNEGFAHSTETMGEIFSQPLFVLYRNLCFNSEGDSTRQPVISILAEMSEKCSSISYLLLFYICFGKGDQSEISTSAYMDLCRLLDRPLMQQILSDLEQCHIDDYTLFAHLVPCVYEKFSSEAIGNVELIKLLTHSLDAKQVADLIGETIRENIILFKKDSFTPILNASLSWETTAQFIFWQMVLSEHVQIDWILPLISKLDCQKHAEAATYIYIMLQRMDKEPNMYLIRNLFSRTSADMFTTNCLKLLIRDSQQAKKVAELLAKLLDKIIREALQVVKPKRPTQVDLDQFFAHLDNFRQNCLSKDSHAAEYFLSRPVLQEAFTSARSIDKISPLRIRFSELFAVMEILSDDVSQSVRSLRRMKVSRKAVENEEESRIKQKRGFVTESDSD